MKAAWLWAPLWLCPSPLLADGWPGAPDGSGFFIERPSPETRAFGADSLESIGPSFRIFREAAANPALPSGRGVNTFELPGMAPGRGLWHALKPLTMIRIDGSSGGAREAGRHVLFLAKYEITAAQWLAVMGSLPDGMDPRGDGNLPVCAVTFEECQAFCAKLNGIFPEAGVFRPPTAAEWENALRAGEPEDNGAPPEDAASNGGTPGPKPAGSVPSNALGLCGMIGNAAEWVLGNAADGKPEPALAGGDWRSPPEESGAVFEKPAAGARPDTAGFRVALEAAEGAAGGQ